MLVEFTLSVQVEPFGKDGYLTDDQSEGLDAILSSFEEILGKNNLELDNSIWEEV